MNIARMNSFTISLLNQPGELAKVISKLRDSKVNLQAMWGYALDDGAGRVMVVPSDEAAFNGAAQQAGWEVTSGSCFYLSASDTEGCLAETFDKISDAGINLLATDAVAVNGSVGSVIWSKPEDVEKLAELLGA